MACAFLGTHLHQMVERLHESLPNRLPLGLRAAGLGRCSSTTPGKSNKDSRRIGSSVLSR